jgi:sugar phosphate permease
MSDIALGRTAETSDDDILYSRLMRRLVPFLLLCYVVSYLDRVNVGFAKLQMLGDLKFSETVYGLGAGIFFIGYVLFEIPSSLVLLRAGPRIWIGRIMITWGVVSALTLFASTPFLFYLFRFLLGAAEAGFIPAVLYYMTIWFPSSRRGKATASFMIGIPLSGIVGAPLSGWIMSTLSGASGLAGWQWMFLLEGLPSVLLGIACLCYLDNSVEAARWLTPEEKQRIQHQVAQEAAAKPLTTLRQGLADGRVWLLSCTYFFFTMGLYGLSFWLPSILRDTGIKDPLNVGLLTAIPYIGALVAMYLVGVSSDRLRERRWHLALPAVTGALGLALSVVYAHDTVLALAALTVAASGVLTCIPQFYTLPPAILGGTAAAIGLAVANSVGSVAGFISPYLLGWIKDLTGSTNVGVLVLTGALLVGAALVFANPAKLVNR